MPQSYSHPAGPEPDKSPDILGALLGPLPEGWRENRPPAADAGRTEADQAAPPRVPGAPETPWQLSRNSWMAIGKRVIHQFSSDRVTSVAGGVTFFGLLALFPAITALVSIYGLLADPSTIAGNLEMLDQVLPEGAMELIEGQVTAIASASGTSLSIAGIVAILAALWTANGGM